MIASICASTKKQREDIAKYLAGRGV